MRVRVRVGGLVVVALVATACSFDLADVLPPDGELPGFGIDAGTEAGNPPPPPGPDAGDPDVGTPVEAGPCATEQSKCKTTVPADWEIVSFTSDTRPGCAGGLTPSDVVSNPTSNGSECKCAACTAVTPSCNDVSMMSFTDTSPGAQCTNAGATTPGNGGNCRTLTNGTLGNHGKIAPVAAPGGTCTSKGATNNAPGADQGRVCSPPPGCGFAGCGDAKTACIIHAGDVPCAGSWTTKTLVGTSVAVACADCSCTVGASCTGTLNFYSDNACTVMVDATIVDNVCHAHSANGFNSEKWVPAPTNVTCTPGSPPAGTLSLTVPRTLCCP